MKEGQYKKANLIFYWILVLVTTIGFLLAINRYSYHFLPNNNWRILFDHFITGFLAPLWFFIMYLGIGSFFHPNRKIVYSVKWFLIWVSFHILLIVLWDGILQSFRDIDQILSELFGILFGFIYFMAFRKLKYLKYNVKVD